MSPPCGVKSTSRGLIEHGRTRCWKPAPVYWFRETLQRVHHHWKEELCPGYICRHCYNFPLLQVEAQEAEAGHSKVISGSPPLCALLG
ncbi:hypothetical protein MATL_G00190970 [Megalops atlanticus]|uniref:Uncharacterized protein n=1 Tax=Megalops atlanticus TaxID=7932 RepID=A0A9D3T5V9_MEGAT|nr:hypothetical protein MATL_G00190970 [Megalops atlanticus]